MRKFIMLFIIVTFNNIILGCEQDSINSEQISQTTEMLCQESSWIVDLWLDVDTINKSDFIAVIKVNDYLRTEQDYYISDFPGSLFNVKVIESIKGNTESEVVVSVWGGIDEFGCSCFIENFNKLYCKDSEIPTLIEQDTYYIILAYYDSYQNVFKSSFYEALTGYEEDKNIEEQSECIQNIIDKYTSLLN